MKSKRQICGRQHCGIESHIREREWIHNCRLYKEMGQKAVRNETSVENEESLFDKNDVSQKTKFLNNFFCIDISSLIVPYTLELSGEQKRQKEREEHYNSFTD